MKQKRSHIGCLFWVALILLLVVVFLFNRPRIDQVLATTGLTSLFTKKAPQTAGPKIVRKPEIAVPSAPQKQPMPPAAPTPQPTPPPTSSVSPNHSKQNSSSDTGGSSISRPLAPTKVIRRFNLYFVKVDTDGRTVLEPVSQKIEFDNSPLTKTFDTLLEGVTPSDRGNGLRSLIPEGTRLLSATVRDGTAYLDFNDRFRFNSYGVDGYNAQLEQVVYTATQFSTVRRVQILLNGRVRKFLAPEGIAIDKPLDRASFSS